MLARLELKLGGTEPLSYQMTSSFHGALMELLPEYAAELHESRLHPYTQHLERRESGWYWVVTALNDLAVSEIMGKALRSLDEVRIRSHQLRIPILGREYRELSDREFSASFYQEEGGRYIGLQFVTPTAFKQNGRYLNFPDLRFLFLNLMNKYDAAISDSSMRDDEVLEQLLNGASLHRYELRSTVFSLEGVRIPAFLGKMVLKISGTQTMANFARMLFLFGSYSGIGIKTALGMGAIRILEERKTNHEGGAAQAEHRKSFA